MSLRKKLKTSRGGINIANNNQNNRGRNNNGNMSFEEAGRIGGEATSNVQEFYEEIGKKDGESIGYSNNN